MNNTQISEDRHPSRDREIAEQIESALSNHPGIPRESLYMRLRGRTNDAELAAARRQVLVEALKDLLRSGAVVEARVGTQALLYLKGEQPQGAAVYSLHQPPMKTWVDPSLKGSYAPTERVVDERTISPPKPPQIEPALIAPKQQRRGISTTMLAGEADQFYQLAAQRGATASTVLCQLVRDFIARESGGKA